MQSLCLRVFVAVHLLYVKDFGRGSLVNKISKAQYTYILYHNLHLKLWFILTLEFETTVYTNRSREEAAPWVFGRGENVYEFIYIWSLLRIQKARRCRSQGQGWSLATWRKPSRPIWSSWSIRNTVWPIQRPDIPMACRKWAWIFGMDGK